MKPEASSKGRAYYNENDPKTAAWLRELIKAGLIADGEVDTRSIVDVSAGDVRGFVQCHFFAGIGGWSYALRLAGWPDDRAVWTGSCPCQPFSSAGAQAGGHDPRDLWPAWFLLVRECRPLVVFGEQVESAIAHGWYDRVCDDLEREGYAVGAASLPAASVGAFHIRQRLWFVGESTCADQRRYSGEPRNETGARCSEARPADGHAVGGAGKLGGLADAAGTRRERACRKPEGEARHETRMLMPGESGDISELADPEGNRRRQGRADASRGAEGIGTQGAWVGSADDCGSGMAISNERRCEVANLSIRPKGQDEAETVERGAGFWSAADWIPCADGKARPVEPGSFPLAHGVPARVGRLRGYGNAIVPQVAAAFIRAYDEAQSLTR